MDNFLKGLQDVFISRVKNMLLLNFFIAWSIWNYDIVMTIVFDEMKTQEKIAFIQNLDITFYNDFLMPLIFTAIYIYIIPLLNLWIVIPYNRFVDRRIKEHKNKTLIEHYKKLDEVERIRLEKTEFLKDKMKLEYEKKELEIQEEKNKALIKSNQLEQKKNEELEKSNQLEQKKNEEFEKSNQLKKEEIALSKQEKASLEKDLTNRRKELKELNYEIKDKSKKLTKISKELSLLNIKKTDIVANDKFLNSPLFKNKHRAHLENKDTYSLINAYNQEIKENGKKNINQLKAEEKEIQKRLDQIKEQQSKMPLLHDLSLESGYKLK